jgi:hypothetical protein
MIRTFLIALLLWLTALTTGCQQKVISEQRRPGSIRFVDTELNDPEVRSRQKRASKAVSKEMVRGLNSRREKPDFWTRLKWDLQRLFK